MLSNYGFKYGNWEAAKIEARNILVDTARRGDRIAFSELVQSIKSIAFEADDHRLVNLLDEISIAEEKAGRGMLSAVVVSGRGAVQPGPGFSELAKSLGKDTSDILQTWMKELDKVHHYWTRS
jgi:hypothetical protein